MTARWYDEPLAALFSSLRERRDADEWPRESAAAQAFKSEVEGARDSLLKSRRSAYLRDTGYNARTYSSHSRRADWQKTRLYRDLTEARENQVCDLAVLRRLCFFYFYDNELRRGRLSVTMAANGRPVQGIRATSTRPLLNAAHDDDEPIEKASDEVCCVRKDDIQQVLRDAGESSEQARVSTDSDGSHVEIEDVLACQDAVSRLYAWSDNLLTDFFNNVHRRRDAREWHEMQARVEHFRAETKGARESLLKSRRTALLNGAEYDGSTYASEKSWPTWTDTPLYADVQEATLHDPCEPVVLLRLCFFHFYDKEHRRCRLRQGMSVYHTSEELVDAMAVSYENRVSGAGTLRANEVTRQQAAVEFENRRINLGHRLLQGATTQVEQLVPGHALDLFGPITRQQAQRQRETARAQAHQDEAPILVHKARDRIRERTAADIIRATHRANQRATAHAEEMRRTRDEAAGYTDATEGSDDDDNSLLAESTFQHIFQEDASARDEVPDATSLNLGTSELPPTTMMDTTQTLSRVEQEHEETRRECEDEETFAWTRDPRKVRESLNKPAAYLHASVPLEFPKHLVQPGDKPFDPKFYQPYLDLSSNVRAYAANAAESRFLWFEECACCGEMLEDKKKASPLDEVRRLYDLNPLRTRLEKFILAVMEAINWSAPAPYERRRLARPPSRRSDRRRRRHPRRRPRRRRRRRRGRGRRRRHRGGGPQPHGRLSRRTRCLRRHPLRRPRKQSPLPQAPLHLRHALTKNLLPPLLDKPPHRTAPTTPAPPSTAAPRHLSPSRRREPRDAAHAHARASPPRPNRPTPTPTARASFFTTHLATYHFFYSVTGVPPSWGPRFVGGGPHITQPGHTTWERVVRAKVRREDRMESVGMELSSLDFTPMALLEEDLGSPERSSRLRGVRGMKDVAAVIGDEKTRIELMPVVHAHIAHEQDDEVLHELARILGDFFFEVGGFEHVALLYAPLGDLARVEETVVHTCATASLIKVINATGVSSRTNFCSCSQNERSVGDLALDVLGQLSGVHASSVILPDAVAAAASSPITSVVGLGAKISAARILAPIIRMLIRRAHRHDKLGLVHEITRKLASDDSPAVRRAVAAELGSIAMAVGSPQDFAHDLADVVWSLLRDEHETVRVMGITTLSKEILSSMPSTAEAWNEATRDLRRHDLSVDKSVNMRDEIASGDTNDGDNDEETLARHKDCSSGDEVLSEPTVILVAESCEDSSWRVREALAQCFDGYLVHYSRLSSAIQGVDHLLTLFSHLFLDREVEVRVAAYHAMNRVAAASRNEFARHAHCVPYSCRGADPGEHPRVRIAAAKALTRLLATLSPLKEVTREEIGTTPGWAQDDTAQRSVFAILDNHLFVAEHVDVLLATLGELKFVVPFLIDDAAQRVSRLIESTNHENWRVRRAISSTLPAIASKRGRDFFETRLLEGYIRSFQDRVCEVRMSAVEALASLWEISLIGESTNQPTYDADWLMEKIGKRLSELYLTMSYYVYRITIVKAFEKLAANPRLADNHMETIVLFLSDAARDEVPNVRFTALTALKTAAARANDRLVINIIKPIFSELLSSDSDPDVKLIVRTANVLV